MSSIPDVIALRHTPVDKMAELTTVEVLKVMTYVRATIILLGKYHLGGA